MAFLPHLLTILAILVPPGRGETKIPIALKTAAFQWAQGYPLDSDRIHSPNDLPVQSESFFESLDETAFDEENSSEVEDHGIAPLTFLNFETSSANNLLSSLLPASPHSQLLAISPILRC